MPGIGGTAGREPVAMTNVFAVSRRPSTSNASGATNRPSPKMTSTPRPRKRSGLSNGSISAMTLAHALHDRARGRVADRTAPSPSARALRISKAIRADLMSVFDGTQPYHRQSPPILCFSTSATLAPSVAAAGGDDEAAGAAADHDDVELRCGHDVLRGNDVCAWAGTSIEWSSAGVEILPPLPTRGVERRRSREPPCRTSWY